MTVALAFCACSEAEPPELPASFERPQRVAFVCLHVESDSVTARPLEDCGDPRRASAGEPILHALVTQTETGEVAAVDLGRGRVIDSRRDIPGFTFVDVGDLPVAIAVPEVASQYTYIANSSGEIGVFQTAAFRPLSSRATRARVQRPVVVLPGPARPSAMVLAPDESALFVASRTTGELFVVPICRDGDACTLGHLGTPIAVPLSSEVSTAMPEPGPADEPYTVIGDSSNGAFAERLQCDRPQRFVLGGDPQWPQAAAPEASAQGDAGVGDSSGDFGEPEPVALAIDVACDGAQPCRPRLLVADRALPFIHRFDIDGLTLTPLPPWTTGVPTRALAVTPDVPVSPGDDERTHYVYAIDDIDGTVLVLQDGKLLPVNSDPAARSERLSFGVVNPGTRALSVEVFTVGDPDPATACDLADDTGAGAPTRLRGVFLAAALNDGTILFYDVDDYDVRDRMQAGGLCRRCPFALKRHRPRIAAELADGPFGGTVAPVVSPDPYYQSQGRTLSIQSNGRSRDPRLPELSCIECPAGMVAAFVDPARRASLAAVAEDDGESGIELCESGQGRICAVADPFFASGEDFVAVYEGSLPNTRGAGVLDPSEAQFSVLSGVSDLCARGVLGEDRLDGLGDRLVLLSAPAPEARDSWRAEVAGQCQAMADGLGAGQPVAAFEIQVAYRDRLELRSENLRDGVADRELRESLPRNLAVVRECYGTSSVPITFEVRSQDSFVIQGASRGFEHRVRAADDGRCVQNTELPATLAGRVFLGEEGAAGPVFNNGRIALALSEGAQALSKSQPLYLLVAVTNPGRPLAYRAAGSAGTAASVLVQELRHSARDDRLYMVDPHVRGLFSLRLTDLSPDPENYN